MLGLINSPKWLNDKGIYNVKLIIHSLSKKSPKGKSTILIVYVNDIILTRDFVEEMRRLTRFLAKEFMIKDLGNFKYFLGMEVAQSQKGILIS